MGQPLETARFRKWAQAKPQPASRRRRLLIVRQLTLAASARSGSRRSASAAPAALGRPLCAEWDSRAPIVATGRFGADMPVDCCNDSPVTIALPMN